jgi:TnpA family transposase
VPVEFLSDEHAAAYGRFSMGPSAVDLARFFFLDDVDLALVGRRRGDHNRLGFALQLGTVRYLGTFLADPIDVPSAVLDFVAERLEIADPSCVKGYVERRSTRFEHQAEIVAEYGYRDFAATEADLVRWVDDRAWNTGDGPKALFDGAVVWLRERRVLLPGMTTLARLAARVRDGALQRLWDTLAELLTAEQARLLEPPLEVPDGLRISDLVRLRRGPTAVFGLLRLLGFDYRPKLADLPDAKLWRINPTADYGPLNPAARGKIDLGRVRQHWADLLRLVGSIHTGAVSAYDVLRMLSPGGAATQLGEALAHLGRIFQDPARADLRRRRTVPAPDQGDAQPPGRPP